MCPWRGICLFIARKSNYFHLLLPVTICCWHREKAVTISFTWRWRPIPTKTRQSINIFCNIQMLLMTKKMISRTNRHRSIYPPHCNSHYDDDCLTNCYQQLEKSQSICDLNLTSKYLWRWRLRWRRVGGKAKKTTQPDSIKKLHWVTSAYSVHMKLVHELSSAYKGPWQKPEKTS